MICTGRSDYPEPGQQRPVLPLHLPRRARCRRDHDQRGDEGRRREGHRRRSPARRRPTSWRAPMAARRIPSAANSLIPSPFDPRLILRIAPAVAQGRDGYRRRHAAARRSRGLCGIARPLRLPLRLHHEAALRRRRRPTRSASSMPRARTSACCAPCRSIVEEGIAKPILIGRPNVVEARIKRFGLSMEIGRRFRAVNPEDDPRYRDYVATYVEAAGRKGITPDAARPWCAPTPPSSARSRVRRGDADALICGLEGRFQSPRQAHQGHHRPGARRARDGGPVAWSSPRRAPTSSPTPMCSSIRRRRRSPT